MTLAMKNKEMSDEDQSDSADTAIEDDDTADLTQQKSGKKRRKLTVDNLTSKKFKSSRFTKQPTTEELNRLHETANLFSSNFFRLQIEEISKEVSIKLKHVTHFNTWLESFNGFLMKLKDSETYLLSDQTWLVNLNAKIPILQEPKETKGFFKFMKPSAAVPVGSYALGCSIGPNLNVDLKIEMPKDMFNKDDYLNDRYHRKRALYVTYLASKLKKSKLVDDLHYKFLHESVIKPILCFKPTGKANKHVEVRLHICADENTFKMARFVPSKNNVREEWRFGKDESNLSVATPFYNNAVLIDMIYDLNNRFLFESINKCNNIKEGIILLKIWLKQRQIHGFSGFIMTMFVAHLINMRRINNAMSSYQVIRNVWTALGLSEWDTNGISVQNSNTTIDQPIIQEFHTHFPIVFVDHSGYNNICSRLSVELYNTVKHESQLAIKFLDNPDTNGFISLFMSPVNFYFKYDHILKIKYTKKLKSMIFNDLSESVKLDCGADSYHVIQKYLSDLLRKGLGKRASFITPLCITEADRRWPIDADIEKHNPFKRDFLFGIKLDSEYAFNSVDKGPEANLPEAESFRKFWGEKSELRRFQDGSICEACLWETSTALCAKRLIIKKIIFYLLQTKLGLDKKIFYIADQFENILHNQRFQPANFEFGTGEDAALKVSSALDGLMKNLRALTEMPLEISSMHGTSAVFSYSDPVPPLAYAPPSTKGFIITEKYRRIPETNKVVPGKQTNKNGLICPLYTQALKVVIQLGHSGKWPDSLDAFQNIKTAFYIQIAEALEKQCNLTVYPHSKCIDVFKDGFLFKLEIAHQKEITLLKKIIDKDGVIKYRDTDESIDIEHRLFNLPRLRIALNGLYHQHHCFGPASCLMKRWIRSHMMDAHLFPDICIDMLMASLFLNPEPYEVPIQPQVAFWRCLNMLANTDWNTRIVLLNFNNDLKREEIAEIESEFSKMRSNLPMLYFVTPYENKKSSIWSRHSPSLQILARIKILATQALKMIDDIVFKNFGNDIDPLFLTNVEGYDIVIHLNKKLNPLHSTNIQNINKKLLPDKLKSYEKTDDEFMPIADFDPVQKYLTELRSSYDDFALFFHDTYGGDKIAVLWKPLSLQFKEFKISHVNGRKPITKDGMDGLIVDIDSILEGFCILGEGLVENIENLTNVSL